MIRKNSHAQLNHIVVALIPKESTYCYFWSKIFTPKIKALWLVVANKTSLSKSSLLQETQLLKPTYFKTCLFACFKFPHAYFYEDDISFSSFTSQKDHSKTKTQDLQHQTKILLAYHNIIMIFKHTNIIHHNESTYHPSQPDSYIDHHNQSIYHPSQPIHILFSTTYQYIIHHNPIHISFIITHSYWLHILP